MAKSVLVICQSSPWSGTSAREALDLVLAGGVFELPISLLFLDDGVWQLVAKQQPKTIEQKDLCANLQALPLFGIEKLWVAEHSLQERGLFGADLLLPVSVLAKDQLAGLLQQHDVVLNL